MRKQKVLRVGMLPNAPSLGVCLYCPFCVYDYSAHRGDYFLAHPRMEMRCSHCDTPLVLVRKVTTRTEMSK